jgi:hypothetical protein
MPGAGERVLCHETPPSVQVSEVISIAYTKYSI